MRLVSENHQALSILVNNAAFVGSSDLTGWMVPFEQQTAETWRRALERLATTMAPNIRVNSISPGGVFRNQPEAFVERYADRTPLRRMATEQDIRGIIAYLATDLSEYVTGQNIVIDGGWGLWKLT